MEVIDLFCGCGGFSHGFQQAGFKIKYGVDNDKCVKETYEYNHPGAEFILSDIKDLNPNDFKDVDIIIGSPPCTEFSVAKKRTNPQKGLILVNEFLKWVSIIEPKFWIGENVPGLNDFLPRNFSMKKKILNAADFGVPQIRKRLFFGRYPTPEPTHSRFSMISLTGKKLRQWITVKEAIKDLIDIVDKKIFLTDQIGKTVRANSPFYEATNRPSRTITSIPQREIPNLELMMSSQESIKRKLKSSFGMQKRYQNFNIHKPSCTITDMHGDAPVLKFKKKHPSLDLEKSSSGGITKDENLSIEHLFYRRLTIRECARLQSFPDSFVFFGSKSTCYKMIGNAVPPLMARNLAIAIKEKMKK